MHLKRSFAKHFSAFMHIHFRTSLLFLLMVFVPWFGAGLYAGVWDQIARVQGLYQVVNLREGMHDERYRLLHTGLSDTLTYRELHRTFDLPADLPLTQGWFIWLYACPVNTRILVNGTYITSLQADSFGVVIPVPPGVLQPFRNELVLLPERPVQSACMSETWLLCTEGRGTGSRILFPNIKAQQDSALILDQCRDTLAVRRLLREAVSTGARQVFLTEPPTLAMLTFLRMLNIDIGLNMPGVVYARLQGNDTLSWFDRNGNRTPFWGIWVPVESVERLPERMNQTGRIWTYCCIFLFGIAMVLIRFTVPSVFTLVFHWMLGAAVFVQDIRKGTFLKPLKAYELIVIQIMLEVLALPMVWTASGWAGTSGYFSWLSFPSVFSTLCCIELSIYPHLTHSIVFVLGWMAYRLFWFVSFAWISGLTHRLHVFTQSEVLTGIHEVMLGSFLAILMMMVPASYVVPLLVAWGALLLIRLLRRVYFLWAFSGQILGFRGFVRILYICVLEFLPVIILF